MFGRKKKILMALWIFANFLRKLKMEIVRGRERKQEKQTRKKGLLKNKGGGGIGCQQDKGPRTFILIVGNLQRGGGGGGKRSQRQWKKEKPRQKKRVMKKIISYFIPAVNRTERKIRPFVETREVTSKQI